MKNKILFLLALLVLTSFGKASLTDFNIVGKWKGEDEKDIGFITFDADGYAFFEYKGEVIGGKEFEINGKKGTMTYAVNYSKTPIEIDIIVEKIESGEIKTLKGIAENIDNNTVKIQLNINGERPTEFNDLEAIIFQRIH